jgi:hypothetical protein
MKPMDEKADLVSIDARERIVPVDALPVASGAV